MIPINNSDFAWLVTADYNQDNGIGFPEALREDVAEPDVNDGQFELEKTFTLSSPIGEHVGYILYHLNTDYAGDDCLGVGVNTNMANSVGGDNSLHRGARVGGCIRWDK